MRILPLEIRKQPFRRSFRGFDPDEVNSFLKMVADEYESVIKSNNEQGTRIKELETRLEHYMKIEKTLNDTLLTAQRATDEARLNAQKEAELILRDAQIRADSYEDESRRRVNDLQSELVSLKTQRDSFLARFKSMLTTQLALVETISEDLGAADEDNHGVSEQKVNQDSVHPPFDA